MSDDDQPLDHLDDSELGRLVRETPTFRTAVACREFVEAVRELRDGDTDVYDRLIDETHDAQESSVSKYDTTAEIVSTFLDQVEDYAGLADDERKDELVDEAVDEVVENEDDELGGA
jgi:hypothetical protein